MSQGQGSNANVGHPGANEGHSQSANQPANPEIALKGLRVVYTWGTTSGMNPGLKECLTYAANTIKSLEKELENTREKLLLRDSFILALGELIRGKLTETSLTLDLDLPEKPRYAYETEP